MSTSTRPRHRHARASHPRLIAAIAAALLAGCAVPPERVPADPATDFTAHVDHRGLVIDHGTDGREALVTSAHTLPFSAGPKMVVESQGATVAAFWQPDLDHIAVRHSQDEAAPVVGRAEATWKDGILRLRIDGTGGVRYTTSRFRRIDGRASPQALGIYAQTVIDVDGAYQAELRDEKGQPVGWLRVEVDPSQQAVRIYQGDLPRTLDPEVVTAAAALLDADLEDIESRTNDVYLGN